jgi:hypothetical protein
MCTEKGKLHETQAKACGSRNTIDEENVYLQNIFNMPRTRQNTQHKCVQI